MIETLNVRKNILTFNAKIFTAYVSVIIKYLQPFYQSPLQE